MLSLVIRFALLFSYIIVHYWDHVKLVQCPIANRPKYYGEDSFGGRFKYLSHLTQWVNSIYFFAAFIVEMFGFADSHQVYTDYFFTTVCCGMSIGTVVVFWGLYCLDRELIYPAYMDDYLPVYGKINLSRHMWPLLAFMIECILLPHYHPPVLIIISILAAVNLLYTSWILLVHRITGKWPYDFMKDLAQSNIKLFSFFLAFFVINVLFYILGKYLGVRFGQIII